MGKIFRRRGIALYMVVCMLIVVLALAFVVANLLSSHFRFTHHEVQRIRAYYAAMAGLVVSYDQLRRGDWPTNAGSTHSLFCTGTCEFPDAAIPFTVDITVGAPGTSIDGTGQRIDAAVDYTYTP
jgi:Tfp pilus assembly protein PilX